MEKREKKEALNNKMIEHQKKLENVKQKNFEEKMMKNQVLKKRNFLNFFL